MPGTVTITIRVNESRMRAAIEAMFARGDHLRMSRFEMARRIARQQHLDILRRDPVMTPDDDDPEV